MKTEKVRVEAEGESLLSIKANRGNDNINLYPEEGVVRTQRYNELTVCAVFLLTDSLPNYLFSHQMSGTK